jgi:hypothetical protein
MDKVIIEEISLKELDEILKSPPIESDINGSKKIKNFTYVDVSTANDRIYAPYQTNYKRSKNLKEFEKQAIINELDSEYDISIVAMKENELIGVLSLKWFYDNFKDIKLWNYRNRFISVKNEYKNKGIATQMLQKLESSKSIEGKVLRFGNFSPQGKLYLQQLITKIFCNENYIILPKDDWKYNKPFPKKLGCYLIGDYD